MQTIINDSAVPSLLQLTLSYISKLSLWSFTQDIPESAASGLLQKIKHTGNIPYRIGISEPHF
jgi:hypothetical protein